MNKVTKRDAANLLRRGANRIAAFGLARGAYQKDGSFCVLGSVGQRGYGDTDWLSDPLRDYAITAFEQVVGFKAPEFNDEIAADKNDVVQAMRRAAYALDHGLDMTGYYYQHSKGENYLDD